MTNKKRLENRESIKAEIAYNRSEIRAIRRRKRIQHQDAPGYVIDVLVNDCNKKIIELTSKLNNAGQVHKVE